MMSVAAIALRLAIASALGYEAYLAFGPRRNRRRRTYNAALQRAEATGKPLVVVGDPDGGIVNKFFGRDYDCGRLCIDKVGCQGCPEHVTGQLEDVLPTMPTDSAVIFVSATLEYVSNIERVLQQLHRVSGGDLFVMHVEPASLTAWLYPGAQQRIFQAPPEGALKYKPLPWSA